jgi:hypothetical protein
MQLKKIRTKSGKKKWNKMLRDKIERKKQTKKMIKKNNNQ